MDLVRGPPDPLDPPPGVPFAQKHDEESWAQEREALLEMLAHQQRVAQAGLITAALAHDVQNQLTVIGGLASLSVSGHAGYEAQDVLPRILERTHQLADMTQAFLSFVRRSRVTPRCTFSAADAVQRADRLVRPLARQVGVKLETCVRGDGRIQGDIQLLIQAVVNLTSNALNAVEPKHGLVQLHLTNRADGQCQIEVADNGPGIPEPLRGQLFRPFITKRSDGHGHGLGLFVVRQAVRRLGGSIRVKTSPRGTCFQIEQPVMEVSGHEHEGTVVGLPVLGINK
ncbi:MAG: HAMP domain-containing histidine kinase [bacterium]|nr:HAMP domain-containing histidine kinase [bacterium]